MTLIDSPIIPFAGQSEDTGVKQEPSKATQNKKEPWCMRGEFPPSPWECTLAAAQITQHHFPVAKVNWKQKQTEWGQRQEFGCKSEHHSLGHQLSQHTGTNVAGPPDFCLLHRNKRKLILVTKGKRSLKSFRVLFLFLLFFLSFFSIDETSNLNLFLQYF